MLGIKRSVCIIFATIMFQMCAYSLEIENTADNPRLVNLSPQQFRMLDGIEKRVFNRTFWGDNTIDRIERLEIELFDEIKVGSPTQRLNTLRFESTQLAISGTPMTPMMQSTFNTKYINAKSDVVYRDDVGIIDGLIKVWWPDFYEQLSEYRKYKEADFW